MWVRFQMRVFLHPAGSVRQQALEPADTQAVPPSCPPSSFRSPWFWFPVSWGQHAGQRQIFAAPALEASSAAVHTPPCLEHWLCCESGPAHHGHLRKAGDPESQGARCQRWQKWRKPAQNRQPRSQTRDKGSSPSTTRSRTSSATKAEDSRDKSNEGYVRNTPIGHHFQRHFL